MLYPILLLASFKAVLGHPFAPRAQHVSSTEVAGREYDYVIVGAGTAGLTVADRLSEDGKYTVLVIETGGFYDPSSPSPEGCGYSFPSVPQQDLNNRVVPALVGNCVGGSSAINGMALMRASARDYDLWAELGGKRSTWNWKGIFPYFKKAIHFKEPNATYAASFNLTYDRKAWGTLPNTRVYASFSSSLRPLHRVGYQALRKIAGLAFPQDGSKGTHGVFYYPLSKDPATESRSYARTGHWDGLNRPNYHLVTEARVNKINLQKKRAVSVQFVPADGPGPACTVKAKQEVILSAGALRTPQILQLSGIGPKRLLQSAGIDVVVDLPGVGANFQDHPIGPSITFNWTPPDLPPLPPPNIQLSQGLAAVLSLPLIAPANYRSLAAKYAAQDIASYLPPDTHPTVIRGQRKIQSVFAREMRKPDVSFLNYIVSGVPSAQPIGFHIASRGTVSINATDPESHPVVDYRALSNPLDIDLMVAYLRFLRWHFRTNYAEYSPVEVVPGEHVQSDEALARHVVQGYSPQGWHPVGTAAKMPKEDGGVVDEELVVHGTDNLRVVDASIMPALVAAATQQTVYAIAEKAADIIKSARRHG
ncbi:hypothetical protein VTJ83DRAFT_166 [Remersonia thermophila]|uniref:Glucose-methanol-choline oxidoreductase N-terminal domain-containing protein n=1 Tax=Remersonia thermophila TaxID=72144 RepID=A0ABR4DKW4_9PEZI